MRRVRTANKKCNSSFDYTCLSFSLSSDWPEEANPNPLQQIVFGLIDTMSSFVTFRPPVILSRGSIVFLISPQLHFWSYLPICAPPWKA